MPPTSTKTGDFALTLPEFERRYHPLVLLPDGNETHTYAQTLSHDIHNVWSILNCHGVMFACAGYRVVDCVGYLITNHPWEDQTTEARIYYEPCPDCEGPLEDCSCYNFDD